MHRRYGKQVWVYIHYRKGQQCIDLIPMTVVRSANRMQIADHMDPEMIRRCLDAGYTIRFKGHAL